MFLSLWAVVFTGCLADPVSTQGLSGLYWDLKHDAESFGYKSGQWTEDFGDAAAFGPTFYAHAGLESGDVDDMSQATEAATYNRSVLSQATDDIAWLAANMEEVFMAAQGAITWAGVVGDNDTAHDVDALIDVIDPVVASTGDYMDLAIGDFAADLYGPTALTGGVAVIYVQHAHYLNDTRSPQWLERAVEIVQTIDDTAFTGEHYQFSPDDDQLYLYPNAIMLIVLNRLYELTGDPTYLARAEQVYTGIQPLYNEQMALYYSPYSVVSQGATTDEYSTLSSQNYLMLGLMELYKHTGDETYRDDVVSILQSVKQRLYNAEDGLLVHHWIDGRPANHDDPDYFCSGCNLQTLFILWYLEHVLGQPLL